MAAGVLAAAVLASQSSHAQPAAGEPPATTALPDSAWESLIGKLVRLQMNDHSEFVGELSAVDAETATIIASDGQIVAIPRANVAGVRMEKPAAETPAAETPAPAPAAAPAPADTGTSTQPGCTSDIGCRHPRTCEAGQCVITERYLDALHRQARGAIIGGAVTTGVGAAALGAGLAMSFTVDEEAGIAPSAIGLAAIIAGVITLSVGLAKRSRWKGYEGATSRVMVAPVVGRGQRGLGAAFRF